MTVSAEENKLRLEDVLLRRFPRLSKMYLREVVKAGACEVNGYVENIGKRVRPNDLIEIFIDTGREASMVPEDIALDIRYEDDRLVVVNKPAGMLVHPSHREKTGTLLNALKFRFDQGSGPAGARPGLVHRLDRDTSGLMVVAKDTATHKRLAAQFAKKTVEKRYMALVHGAVASDSGTIEAPIGRYPEEKRWGVRDDGKPSESRFTVRERFANATLLELEPVTGRTNQLRIHCAFIGHPIFGDRSRGGPLHERLCLHAYRLAFDDPHSRERLRFESDAELRPE